MNLSSNAFLNRIEIAYYSALTSCLSGVERIRELIHHKAETPPYRVGIEEQTYLENFTGYPDPAKLSRWSYYRQAFVSLAIWMILGFAAGFLIGLINPK